MSGMAEEQDTEEILHTAISVLELSQKVQDSISQHFARYGLTQSRFLILAAMMLHPDETWTPAGLASLLGVKAPTVSGILNGLLNAGFVTGERSEEDRRVVMLKLTQKGRQKISKILPDHFRRLSSAFSNLSQNRKSLDTVIGHISRSLEDLKKD